MYKEKHKKLYIRYILEIEVDILKSEEQGKCLDKVISKIKSATGITPTIDSSRLIDKGNPYD